MKKELLLFVLCLAFYGLNAQILLEENFDDGTRGSLIAVDVDGATPNPNVGVFTEAWQPREMVDGFGFSLVSNSWYTPAGQANDWLITPALEIDSEGYSFAFRARAIDASFPDGYNVWVSTTDGEVASFTEQILSVPNEITGSWNTQVLNLDAYVGQTIHLAIQNNSNDQFLLVVDDLLVGKLKEFDVAAAELTNRRWNSNGSSVSPIIVIENNGTEIITSVDVTTELDGVEQTFPLSVNIPALSTGTATIPQAIAMVGTNQYELSYTLSNPNGNEDENMEDNNNSGFFNSQLGNASKKMVVEEGTGTWCTFCPRGHVFMEIMAEEYPDDFIGIAVHNRDPMAFDEHDGNMNLSGYPGTNINRFTRNIDPSDLSISYINSEAARVSPIEVSAAMEYNSTSRELTVTATATSLIDITNADIRFSVIITEDGVTGTTSGYDQVNFYSGGSTVMGGYENLPNPVPASQMVYEDVSRAILGGFDGLEGSFPETIVTGEPVNGTFTYTIPADYDDTQMQAVVVVLDATSGEILNANEVQIQTTVNIFETPELVEAKLSPNPAIDLATIYLPLETAGDVTVSVFDLSGKLMKNSVYNSNAGNVSYNIIVSDLNAGMYIVRVDTPDGVATKRLAVAK